MNTLKGKKSMWKPLGVAAMVLLVVSGCGNNGNSEGVGGGSADATSAPSASESATTQTAVDENSDVEGLKSNIDPAKVEIPKEIKERFVDAEVDKIAYEAQDFAATVDNQGFLQKPDEKISDYKNQWMNTVGQNMITDVAEELWADINDENGSSLVAMWVGDDKVKVGSDTYTLTDDAWQFAYGDPVVSILEKTGDVQYAQQVRYHIPVVDDEGTQKWVTTDVTRTYNLSPGDEEQPWLITGMWANSPSAYKIQEVKETQG